MDEDLKLKDYEPHTTIVTAEHLVDRARFPAVDAHNHFDLVPAQEVDARVAIMDACNVKAAVNLSGFWGDQLERLMERFEGRHPGRFCTFANVDWTKAVEPGFVDQAARSLEDSVRRGAKGLKVLKEFGLRYRGADGRLLRVDDERFAPIWDTAGELGVPVLIHVADPVAFFQPLDRHNELYLSLIEHPDWHFYGSDFPSFHELIEAGIRLMARHPKTKFITAHVGWYAENLGFVGAQMLERLPNMYVDISARLFMLGRAPRTAREFFVKYQDRILFGIDSIPPLENYRRYFRFLETMDENFVSDIGISGPRVYGVGLPDEVLEKVYHSNAEKLIPGLAGHPSR